jgi:hypothetical protein
LIFNNLDYPTAVGIIMAINAVRRDDLCTQLNHIVDSAGSSMTKKYQIVQRGGLIMANRVLYYMQALWSESFTAECGFFSAVRLHRLSQLSFGMCMQADKDTLAKNQAYASTLISPVGAGDA